MTDIEVEGKCTNITIKQVEEAIKELTNLVGKLPD